MSSLPFCIGWDQGSESKESARQKREYATSYIIYPFGSPLISSRCCQTYEKRVQSIISPVCAKLVGPQYLSHRALTVNPDGPIVCPLQIQSPDQRCPQISLPHLDVLYHTRDRLHILQFLAFPQRIDYTNTKLCLFILEPYLSSCYPETLSSQQSFKLCCQLYVSWDCQISNMSVSLRTLAVHTLARLISLLSLSPIVQSS